MTKSWKSTQEQTHSCIRTDERGGQSTGIFRTRSRLSPLSSLTEVTYYVGIQVLPRHIHETTLDPIEISFNMLKQTNALLTCVQQ